jgi:Ca2+-binding RTX toxin-like protein
VKERITRPVALFVVSVLMVALTAGVALAQKATGASPEETRASETGASSKADTKSLYACNAVLNGTIYDDFLDDAGYDRNCVFGYSGHDIIAGYTFADVLDGGYGDDRIFGEHAGDTIVGSDGHDTVNPGPGDDWVSGSSGNDVFNGAFTYSYLGSGWQNDEQGNDRLNGDAGNDYIIDWVGTDKAYGGYDNDTINLKDNYCYDIASAGSGYDTVYADSCDYVYAAENVYKSAAGAKSTAEMERPTPPKLSAKSSAHPKSVR